MNGLRGTGYTGGILERTLDALGLRHRVTAHNVANVSTPGYKPLQVTFEQALRRALADESLSGRTVSDIPLRVVESTGGRVREDGNGVDIDQEMATVAKTTIAYNAVTQQWSGLYTRLRMAVREGRR
ncbi:MAG: flagellar basal body rod protein FlgB [Limnochordia bacterium]